jgi:5-(carboxyamino)imidazole ribonucleotide synthase
MHIAILGSGQLARMLALAGWPMGIQFSFVAEADEDTRCVDGLGKVVRLQGSMSPEMMFEALGKPDVITVEKEAVDTTLLRQLSQFSKVAPNPDILWTVQHRGRQKDFLRDKGIATAPYVEIHSKAELLQAAQTLGYPLIIKSCEEGYDGQQQWRIRDEAQARNFIDDSTVINDAVVEKMINFSIEVSVIVVRNSAGAITVYEPSENRHTNGTLSVSIAPTETLNTAQRKQLQDIVNTLMDAMDYVGVLAIECFVADGQISVNELAPRVHNSGHWTQEGAICSQFENHLRAISGQSLGSTTSLGHSAMINLLGCVAPEDLVAKPNAHLHWYNKTLRQGRKMGHVNLLHTSPHALQEDLDEALRIMSR